MEKIRQETPVVETAYGPVRGTVEDSILAFRGIPYAAPPVGDRRFKAPEPPEPWTEPREATQFGLLEPHEVKTLLLQRQARQAKRSAAKQGILEHAPEKSEAPQALHRTLGEQRKLLNSLVGMYSRISGDPHASIHTELRRVCGGPAVAQASVTQLQQRIELLRRRLGS